MTPVSDLPAWTWFPQLDPVGPDSGVAAEVAPLPSVRAVCLDLLAPTAAASDTDGVSRSHLTALAGVGVLGPVSPAPVQREIGELIAGACGTTWFCWTQHRSPTEIVSSSANSQLLDRWAKALGSGRALAGVAFAHVRRPGAPSVRAEAAIGGWHFSGELDWVTSWTIADVIVVVAETSDAQLVQAVIEPRPQHGLVVAPTPLPLAAMGGTHTYGVQLDKLFVAEDQVAAVVDKAAWLERDATTTVNAAPHIFGVARAAIALLEHTGQQRHLAEAVDLAARLTDELRRTRRMAYALIDDALPEEFRAERLQLRATALDIAVTATIGAVAARAGAAMRLSDPAQRYAREALFYLVQAQTADTRAATLGRLLEK